MTEIDFLPDRIKAQRARRRRLITQAYLLAMCMAALAALGFMFHRRVQTAQAELALLTDRGDGVRRQLDLRTSLEQQLGDLMIKKQIEEQLGRRASTLDVLAELQRVLPESMALTSLKMETVEVRTPVKGAGGAGSRVVARKRPAERVTKRVRVVLTGLAPSDVDVANFIGQLSASPMFEDVNMGYSRDEKFQQRSARKFQASCYVTR